MKDCNHEWQDIGLVICTIPETKMQGCVKLKCGDQRAHQENIDDKFVAVDLACDICGTKMSMAKHEGSVNFKCASTDCKQTWMFSKEGDTIQSSCTILGVMWPSRMEEGGKMYRENFLPYRRKECKFHAKAKYLAGFITEEEMLAGFAEIDQVIDEWFENNPELPPQEKPWWKFW